MAKKILSLVLALAMVSSFACISAFAANEPKVYDGVIATLDLEGVFEANGVDGAIWAKNGANLTIDGDGTVKGLLGKDPSNGKNYSMALWAQNSNVVIDGGYFENVGDPDYETQSDLIYASAGATIVINGGTFRCATPQWTLNCKNFDGASITVKGGSFYQFDPANAMTDGENEIIVPEGYEVVKEGDWYKVVQSEPKVYDNETAILTLKGKFAANGVDGAIWAKNGANLTINGNGTVKGLLGKDPSNGKNYAMALWAQGSDVVINGGNFENVADPDYETQSDLIYASAGANIEINGGTFKCATPRWTLNCKNYDGATITVKGGKFYQFDPANAQTDGVNEIVVPEGYTVVKEGDWYKVVKEEAKIEFDSASSVKNGEEGAIRFVFNVSLPEDTNTYFGAYMLPLSVFTESGVANAVRVQYAKTAVDAATAFSADLVKIPEKFFTTSIYAIPYIKTANGISMFAGASASVNSAQ